jgi:hypothetical protein
MCISLLLTRMSSPPKLFNVTSTAFLTAAGSAFVCLNGERTAAGRFDRSHQFVRFLHRAGIGKGDRRPHHPKVSSRWRRQYSVSRR